MSQLNKLMLLRMKTQRVRRLLKNEKLIPIALIETLNFLLKREARSFLKTSKGPTSSDFIQWAPVDLYRKGSQSLTE
jgi:hypothetical protein